ncbi:MAG: hypothetical protein QOG60_2726, partial [Frankiaceae bacterium]|nr:hypothetical protein [Frankiaceae bacterium]
VPALDGLRAVAVVAVVAFHFGVGFVRGGLLGVDIFFVLSGFLITSLLLDEHVRRGTVRLREFWGRRARRLLPALLLLVVAVVVSSRWLTDQTDAGSLRDDAIATLAYVANWHFAASGQDYFGALAADSPLLHTWSLGIEEQFYVVWPLVVVLLLRLRRGERWLRYVAVAGAAASTAWLTHLALQGVGTSRLYYGTDTRIAALLVGAALATLRPARLAGGDAGLRNEGRRDELLRRGVAGLGVVGAIALTVAVFVMRGEDPVLYHGGFLVVALAAAAVIAAAVGTPGSALSRALSVAPLRLVGRVSYGIYLWHWPVQLVVTRSRTELGGWALVTARVLITMVLATASYLLVERPVRRLSWATPRRRAVAVAAIAATLATVLLGTTLAAPVEQRAAAAPSESSIGTSGLVPAAAASADVPEPTIPTRSLSASDAPRTPLGRTTRILLVGDSIAATLGWNLGSVQAQTSTDVYLDAPLGCGIVLGQHNDRGNVISDPSECAQWPQRWTREVNSYDPDVVAVLIGRWEMTDRYYQGAWRHLGDPVFDDYVRQQLERAVEIGSSTGAQVALLNPPCLDDPERPDGGAWPQNDPARARRLTELQREVTDAHPGKVQLLDLASLICPGGQYARSIGGVQVRERDGVHFTRSGARFVGRSLLPALRAIAEEDRYRKRHPQSTTSAASANSAGSTTSAASANSRSTG